MESKVKCYQYKPNRDDELAPPDWNGSDKCRAARLLIANEFEAGIGENGDDNKADNMNENVGNLDKALRKVAGEDINTDVAVFACGERCAQKR